MTFPGLGPWLAPCLPRPLARHLARLFVVIAAPGAVVGIVGAELAAVVRASSEGMCLRAIMGEFGISVGLHVKRDAVAAIGIVRRQGLGRICHLVVGGG